MYKKIKNKFLRGLLILLTVLIGLLVGYWMVLYLITPHYQFKVGQPFRGEYLYNPYQDMQPDQWKQYNFHCHSRQYLGLTNGKLSKETDIDSIYGVLGYDHYGISDYMKVNPYHNDQPSYIPAYEHGYGFFRKTHQLCIGAQDVVFMDYPFAQSLDMKQHLLNVLQKHTRFAVPAHASYTNGYKVSDMKYLSGYRLLEICNPFGGAIEHWDAALSTGHRVYGIGDDDSHNVLNPNEVGRCFTMINTIDMTADNVYDALERGCAYTVEFHSYYGKPFEMKVERMHELPHLTRCELVGDTLLVETDAPVIEIAEFIGQDGKVLQHDEFLQQARYVIRPDDTYVRVMLRLPRLTFFYLNPITRHNMPTPTDQTTATINSITTYLYYAVYLLVIIACIRYVWKQIKNQRKCPQEKP